MIPDGPDYMQCLGFTVTDGEIGKKGDIIKWTILFNSLKYSASRK